MKPAGENTLLGRSFFYMLFVGKETPTNYNRAAVLVGALRRNTD